MQYNLKEKITWFAFSSRILNVGLSSLSNCILPDHEPSVFMTPKIDEPLSKFDWLINFLFGGFTHWDAQYFLHIARHGYTYENTLAFFPLYPLLIRVVSTVIYSSAKQLINYNSSLILSSFFINLIFFIKSANVLYELSLVVFKSKTFAYKATIFYCVNPGNIFFSAFYSESCFAFFTFSGMLSLFDKTKWPTACLYFGLSCATRSNGILNLGFIVHFLMKHCLISKNISPLFILSLMTLVSLSPFLLFQLYGYSVYCFGNEIIFSDPVKEYGILNEFVFPGDNIPPWCNASLPLPYSYIQDHYWDVGFLRYYQWKQLPNFLLALPIIIFVLSKSLIVLKENKIIALTLGFKDKSTVKFINFTIDSVMFVYLVHIVFLSLFCTFCIHVQVTTRMLASSSPVLYWFLAACYSDKPFSDKPFHVLSKKLINRDVNSFIETNENMKSIWKVFLFTSKPNNLESKLLRIYLLTYCILGNILFSNYYPWT